ncbi:RNA-binding protein lark-like isoform X2 [Dreissena polymorpha]|uniref:RNA-binding protein lark-like isoform X2 n=1 Tax=Dreissena polymorpha TaxID=45954 RepID=UPI0022650211|nr:RNA-binding protein lark-like isoform X2 [Dreissena polymorpha]
MAFRGRGGGRGGFAGGRKSNAVTTKLYIGNIPETCRKLDLQKLFEEHGKVVECDIVKNYGFVHFESQEEAQAAADALNNTTFQGSVLQVELSHSRVRQKPGMGGKQECYRCGKEGHWSKDCPKGPSRPPGYYQEPDPYEAYYRDRYPPPPPVDRYRPYPDPYDRRPLPPPPPRDPYYRERDPYARPPPDYYSRSRDPYYERTRDPYYDDLYSRQSYMPPPPGTSRMSPPRTRVAPY